MKFLKVAFVLSALFLLIAGLPLAVFLDGKSTPAPHVVEGIAGRCQVGFSGMPRHSKETLRSVGHEGTYTEESWSLSGYEIQNVSIIDIEDAGLRLRQRLLFDGMLENAPLLGGDGEDVLIGGVTVKRYPIKYGINKIPGEMLVGLVGGRYLINIQAFGEGSGRFIDSFKVMEGAE